MERAEGRRAGRRKQPGAGCWEGEGSQEGSPGHSLGRSTPGWWVPTLSLPPWESTLSFPEAQAFLFIPHCLPFPSPKLPPAPAPCGGNAGPWLPASPPPPSCTPQLSSAHAAMVWEVWRQPPCSQEAGGCGCWDLPPGRLPPQPK